VAQLFVPPKNYP